MVEWLYMTLREEHFAPCMIPCDTLRDSLKVRASPGDPKEDPVGEAPAPAAEPEAQAKKAGPAAGQADAAARPVSIASANHDLE